jgi:hypothetical protein
METLEFPGWVVGYDAEATARATSEVPAGGADSCDCDHCQNWVRTRDQVVPNTVKSLLHQLGIPLNRDAEVYHNGRLPSGLHSYAGWFHFVGCIDFGYRESSKAVAVDGFDIWFSAELALVPTQLEGLKLVQLEFSGEVPWLTDLPEPGP